MMLRRGIMEALISQQVVLQGRYRRYKDIRRTLHGRYKDITQMLQGHYCQILTKYDQILVKYYQNDQIHVENFQERHFFRIKKTT